MGRIVVERSLGGRRWIEDEPPGAEATALAQRFDLPEVVARLLAGRGVAAADVPRFLDPRLRDWLPDPSHLLDLDLAAARIADAVQHGARIGVLADYDVDGATSAALVVRWARALDVPTAVAIPNRLTDGYGPSPALLDGLADAGCRLVLVLDSGTTAFAALEHARDRGQEVVVVDHHQPEAALPPALALVNPNRLDQDSPCRTLAAVGVTFLVLIGVNRELRRRGHFAARPEPSLLDLLDLVALGTVADVVPLLGLNRAFVRQGLALMNAAPRVGLAALAEVAGLRPPWGTGQLGFALAPRLNAAGRLAEGQMAASLLATDDPTEAHRLARQLDALNADRREVERDVVEAAARQVAAQARADRRVLLAVGEGWHPGVLGIVAGRLAERFHRPVLVGADTGTAVVGSARAPAGFDLGAALHRALDGGLAVKAGGHARAGGFTVERQRLEAFHDAVEALATAPTAPELRLDGSVAVAGCTARLVVAMARLEPYGEGHPVPRLRVVGGRLGGTRVVGERHLKLWVRSDDGAALDAIAFRAEGTALWDRLPVAVDRPIELAGKLEADRYRGGDRAQLLVDDVALNDG